jgi:hypothetical protein
MRIEEGRVIAVVDTHLKTILVEGYSWDRVSDRMDDSRGHRRDVRYVDDIANESSVLTVR